MFLPLWHSPEEQSDPNPHHASSLSMPLVPTATRTHTAAPATHTLIHPACHTKLPNGIFENYVRSHSLVFTVATGGTDRRFRFVELCVSCVAVFPHSVRSIRYTIDPPAPVVGFMRLWLLGEIHQLTCIRSGLNGAFCFDTRHAIFVPVVLKHSYAYGVFILVYVVFHAVHDVPPFQTQHE